MFDWIDKPFGLWTMKDSFIASLEIIVLIFLLIMLYALGLMLMEKIDDMRTKK